MSEMENQLSIECEECVVEEEPHEAGQREPEFSDLLEQPLLLLSSQTVVEIQDNQPVMLPIPRGFTVVLSDDEDEEEEEEEEEEAEPKDESAPIPDHKRTLEETEEASDTANKLAKTEEI